MRIRNQLLLLVLSILLPAMLASGLAVGYVYKEGQKSQHRSLTEAARAFAFNVEAELQIKIGMLRTLSKSPALLRGDLEAFYPYARRMAPTPETTIILMDESGRQLMNTRRPLGATLPSKRVSNVAALIQKYGADRALISDVFMAPVGKRHDFMIQVPVQTSQERRQYLVMGINASLMQSVVSRQNFPSTWITTIVDRQGVVIARSNKPAQYVGTQIRERSRQILAASRGGMYESLTLDDIPVKAYFHRVPNSDWTVLISIPKAELAELPTRTAAFLGGIILIVLAIAIFAARWMAQRAYRPVEQLGKVAEQLRSGQEVAYVPQGLHEVDSVGQQLAEASRQIRHATQELEKRVAEAVAKTEQAQQALQRSQKLEALGRLTGGIAHEFNNLLQTLMTALQVAKMTSNQERVQTMLDTCKKAVNRATALTGQLSAFGRIQESRLTTIDLNAQILGFRKLIEGILPSNIKLELRLEHAVWPVMVDTVQLELALLNIAINARDAMPSGGRLLLETKNKTLDKAIDNLQPGDYVRICLTDTGAGMAPEVLAKALDPFFTTKAVGKGTGLGLPQAYGFARQAEGTLLINSSVGKGTEVEIFLPRSRGPVTVSATLPKESAHSITAGGTVLFVEDDPLVSEAVIPALGQAGLTVRAATNAEEALSLLESEDEVDVAFSDIMMPGRINGIGLAQLVRERYPDIRIILATGYTDQQVKQDGVTLISKPYETNEVVRLLQEAIANVPVKAP
jgi:signal transduction histidine kinase/CheY-like chemotaxis protein